MSVVRASVLVSGEASGEVLALTRPLSFWGGVDVERGVIISRGHPQAGVTVAGRIVVLPTVIGSSSSSSVLAELLRIGAGPAGLVLGHPDSILAIGSIVAGALYGAGCPIVVLDEVGIEAVAGARRAYIRDGLIDLGEGPTGPGISHTAAPGATTP